MFTKLSAITFVISSWQTIIAQCDNLHKNLRRYPVKRNFNFTHRDRSFWMFTLIYWSLKIIYGGFNKIKRTTIISELFVSFYRKTPLFFFSRILIKIQNIPLNSWLIILSFFFYIHFVHSYVRVKIDWHVLVLTRSWLA